MTRGRRACRLSPLYHLSLPTPRLPNAINCRFGAYTATRHCRTLCLRTYLYSATARCKSKHQALQYARCAHQQPSKRAHGAISA